MAFFPQPGLGGTVQVGNSSQASSNAFGNGVRCIPHVDATTDYVDWQFIPTRTGPVRLHVFYSMSVASSNNVRLRLDKLTLAVGDNPTTAATSGTAFTITPGNDTNVHVITAADSGDLTFSVTAYTIVYLKFNRLGSDGADTHTGDFRLIDVAIS